MDGDLNLITFNNRQLGLTRIVNRCIEEKILVIDFLISRK